MKLASCSPPCTSILCRDPDHELFLNGKKVKLFDLRTTERRLAFHFDKVDIFGKSVTQDELGDCIRRLYEVELIDVCWLNERRNFVIPDDTFSKLHKATTRLTGATARALINEIEEEMAGQA